MDELIRGMQIIVLPKYRVSDFVGYKQRRKHRKKRINKKWLKRYGKKPIYGPEKIYIIDNKLFMGPDTYKALMKTEDGEKNAEI